MRTALRRASIAPVLAQPFTAPATTPTLLTRLWPTDRPIYKRPAAIGGVLLLVVGSIAAWKLLGGGGAEGRGGGVDTSLPPNSK